MRQDHRSGVVLEGFLHHFTRVNAGAIDRAAKEFQAFDQSMPIVQEQYREHLVLARAEFHREVLPSGRG